MNEGFDENYTSFSISFSAQTTANQTQNIIDGKMEKRSMRVYAPKPIGKVGIIYVDDLNMPQKEKYGAQPPIELLRQWMDYSGWYDIVGNEKEFRKIVNIRFVAAIGPPGGGRNHITDRLVRHFNTIYVEPYSNYSQSLIFSSVVEALFLSNSNPSFSKTVVSLKESIVAGTIHMYNKVSEIFLPTPSKSHYTYNLRDVSKVFQGIYASKPKGI